MLSGRARSCAALGVLLVVGALMTVVGVPAHAAGTTYFVSPVGVDTNSGTSATAPFRTIQRALDLAQPGTTINLLPGDYHEAPVTKTAGTATAPITVKGPETGTDVTGRYKTTLYSLGGRAFSVNHSYYTLDGFTIDGQPNIPRTSYPAVTSLSQIRAFKDTVQIQAVNSKLIYVGASTTLFDIVGTTISNMFLNGSGGECVRFRDRAANSLVVNSVIQWCGMLGQGDDVSQYKYHNAEGVYIGTSPKSTDQPLPANDTSNAIVVRDSLISTYGSECFEVKENAHHNRMENTTCGWNDEPSTFQGSNVELRGDHNTVVNSRLSNSRSWNLKLASDSATYDLGGNTAQRSAFGAAATYGIINRQAGSGPFCGDTFAGAVSDPSGNSVGTATVACPDTTAPGAPAGLTATAASATSVNLTWTASTDDVAVKDYLVRRNGTQIGIATAPGYTDTTAAASTAYTYSVVARDAAGNLSAASNDASVTTPAAPAPADTTAPTLTARTPGVNATAVAATTAVTATFSEAVSNVSGSTFTLTNPAGTTVAATVAYDAATRVATLKPSAGLAASTQYTATLTSGITDSAGNPLAPVTWTFSTAAATPPADTTAPTVTVRSPGLNATGFSRTANVTVTFSEAVQGVSGTTFILKTPGGATVSAVVSRNGTTNQWILNPNTTLASSTKYTVTLTGGTTAIRDAAGNPLAPTTWSFTTARF